MAAVIPVEVYEPLVAERRDRFEVIARIRSRLPGVSLEQIHKDVIEAIARIRAESAPGCS